MYSNTDDSILRNIQHELNIFGEKLIIQSYPKPLLFYLVNRVFQVFRCFEGVLDDDLIPCDPKINGKSQVPTIYAPVFFYRVYK